jgi:hypothetical protein
LGIKVRGNLLLKKDTVWVELENKKKEELRHEDKKRLSLVFKGG